MNFIRRHSASLILSLTELVVGILLLISPTGFTRGIIMARAWRWQRWAHGVSSAISAPSPPPLPGSNPSPAVWPW